MSTSSPTNSTNTTQSQFMLLLRQPHGDGPPPTPEEMKGIMEQFGEWMQGMTAQGIVLSTNGLAPTGKVLRGPRGAVVTDGPLIETKEIVGGYALITAETLEEAMEHGRACPGLNYRMAVEVRPVIDRSSQEQEQE